MKVSVILAFAMLPGLLVAARAQSEGSPQRSSQLAHAYRGTFVCEKLPASLDILHVPADLVIRGDQVQFARPMLNPRGTRVVGSELGFGSVDARGAIRIASNWSFNGIGVRGAYEGTLTPGGWTLAGTQTWQRPDGPPRSRACQIALVPAGT